jgi:hypothetical protein
VTRTARSTRPRGICRGQPHLLQHGSYMPRHKQHRTGRRLASMNTTQPLLLLQPQADRPACRHTHHARQAPCQHTATDQPAHYYSMTVRSASASHLAHSSRPTHPIPFHAHGTVYGIARAHMPSYPPFHRVPPMPHNMCSFGTPSGYMQATPAGREMVCMQPPCSAVGGTPPRHACCGRWATIMATICRFQGCKSTKKWVKNQRASPAVRRRRALPRQQGKRQAR